MLIETLRLRGMSPWSSTVERSAGTTVDAERLVVVIQHAALEVGRSRVRPGIALCPRYWVRRPRPPVANIPGIHRRIPRQVIRVVLGV